MKKCINPKCGKEFTPKNPKGKYCSDACRSDHQYQKKKEGTIMPTVPGDLEKKKNKLKGVHPSIKTAAEIPLPKDFVNPSKILVMPKWAQEVEDYCNKAGCTHKDLIEAHKNVGDKPSLKKVFGEKKEKDKPVPGESYLQQRFRMKNSKS